MNSQDFYPDILYPLQDRVIQQIRQVESDFYLTGGTAASRGYLNHRYSDDLDFFVNDDDRFGLWIERIIFALNQKADWKCQVLLKEERFCRLNIIQGEVNLKLEWVNDVPARVGVPTAHPVLGRLDTAENILANKITALMDREEPKDLADIWGFCCIMGISIQDAIKHADSKAAGVFPADLARVLCTVSQADWEVIRWVSPPVLEPYITQLKTLGEQLLLIG